MKVLVIFITCTFSFFLVDFQRLRRRHNSYVLMLSSIDIEDQKQKRKKKTKKKYKNKKYEKRNKYRPIHYKLKGSKPKDTRYSNQRSIRRMYINY